MIFVLKMTKKYHIGKPSIVKKETNCDIISQKKGGGLADFIPLFYFSKHPPKHFKHP